MYLWCNLNKMENTDRALKKNLKKAEKYTESFNSSSG